MRFKSYATRDKAPAAATTGVATAIAPKFQVDRVRFELGDEQHSWRVNKDSQADGQDEPKTYFPHHSNKGYFATAYNKCSPYFRQAAAFFQPSEAPGDEVETKNSRSIHLSRLSCIVPYFNKPIFRHDVVLQGVRAAEMRKRSAGTGLEVNSKITDDQYVLTSNRAPSRSLTEFGRKFVVASSVAALAALWWWRRSPSSANAIVVYIK